MCFECLSGPFRGHSQSTLTTVLITPCIPSLHLQESGRAVMSQLHQPPLQSISLASHCECQSPPCSQASQPSERRPRGACEISGSYCLRVLPPPGFSSLGTLTGEHAQTLAPGATRDQQCIMESALVCYLHYRPQDPICYPEPSF